MKKRILFASVLGCALAGCSMLIPAPVEYKYYSFETTPPAVLTVEPKIRSTIQIYQPSIAEAFAGQNFFVQGTDGRFYKSQVSRLLAPANDLIGDIMRNWFQKTGPWETVLSQNTQVSGRYAMNTMINKLYVQKIGTGGAAVLKMNVQVTNQNSMRLVFQRSVDSRISFQQFTPSAVLEAYNDAIKNCLDQLTEAFQANINSLRN